MRLVRATERRGKEAAQQLALESASGEILIFSDVATALAPNGVSTIVANFADPTVGCVSSIDRFVDADGRVSGEGAYVRYEMFLRALETRVNSLVGLSGSFFAARREVCARWASDRQSDFSTLLNAVDLGLRGVLDVHDRRLLPEHRRRPAGARSEGPDGGAGIFSARQPTRGCSTRFATACSPGSWRATSCAAGWCRSRWSRRSSANAVARSRSRRSTS